MAEITSQKYTLQRTLQPGNDSQALALFKHVWNADGTKNINDIIEQLEKEISEKGGNVTIEAKGSGTAVLSVEVDKIDTSKIVVTYGYPKYHNTKGDNAKTTVTIGGIDAGTLLQSFEDAGLTHDELIQKMLCKVFYPSTKEPSFSMSYGTTLKVGDALPGFSALTKTYQYAQWILENVAHQWGGELNSISYTIPAAGTAALNKYYFKATALFNAGTEANRPKDSDGNVAGDVCPQKEVAYTLPMTAKAKVVVWIQGSEDPTTANIIFEDYVDVLQGKSTGKKTVTFTGDGYIYIAVPSAWTITKTKLTMSNGSTREDEYSVQQNYYPIDSFDESYHVYCSKNPLASYKDVIFQITSAAAPIADYSGEEQTGAWSPDNTTDTTTDTDSSTSGETTSGTTTGSDSNVDKEEFNASED